MNQQEIVSIQFCKCSGKMVMFIVMMIRGSQLDTEFSSIYLCCLHLIYVLKQMNH